jgi:predicted ATPase
MGSLKRIRLEGYKSIRKLDLELKSLNVLIGANGAGKTNLISAFTLLNEIVKHRFRVFVKRGGGADNFLHFGIKNTERISIKLDFGANSYELDLLPTDDDSFLIEHEYTVFNNTIQREGPFRKSLGSGHSETNLIRYAEDWKEKVPQYVLAALRTWKVYHFHDTSSSAKVRRSGDLNDNVELRPDAANLAAFLNRIKVQFPEQYTLLVKTIRIVAPFFDDFSLRPDPLAEERIRLEWRELDSDVYMNAMALSDGTLRFICLATVLLQPSELRPASVVIDEPELGLHPYAIDVLAGLIKQAASKMQVIVSTQSVQLLNNLSVNDIIVVNLRDGVSEFTRLNDESFSEWISEYSLGELWEKNVLGGRPSR